MRILFICHRFPYPPNRGGKIRPFNMIQHLSQRHEIVVASLAHSNEEFAVGQKIREFCSDIIAEVVPNPTRWSRALMALPTGRPSSMAYFYSGTLQKRIRRYWEERPCDVIWVHCAFAAQYAAGLNARFKVLDYGDIDSGKWSDYAHYRAFPLSAGYAIESAKLRRFEKSIATSFDQITVTTRNEMDEFRGFGIDRPCTVIPNGVNSEYFRPLPRKQSGTPVIAFLGRMDYFPNVDGIVRFARSTLPLIRKSVPNLQLRIIGANPAAAVRRLSSMPGVQVTGYVDDIRPHLTDAVASVAPLVLARGTQNKILEAMSMELAVVSSPQAARGVQAVPGEHILVGGTPEEFAEHVIALVRDPEKQRRIGEAARQQVIRQHSWSTSMHILDQVLASAPEALSALDSSHA